MARAASISDFVVPVDDIGSFTFGRRNFRGQIASDIEFARLTEGVTTIDEVLEMFCRAMADLKTFTVQAPADWDVDELDPFDQDSYAKVLKVWGALRDKEAAFRQGTGTDGKAGGQGAGGDGGVVVPPTV
jgi:hypothetical protein